ncbi:aspartate carbamoyltransferase catalytic subunit [Halobacteriovorax sp. DA5]|uniref:aspartate carbamoyltransferase catalytic subunit n=1 Tax=Halobacteriovorax sp. DA5 TaxID=2067553 RepID=UPI000CD13F44|nr:aspartate carbamoyltransferase catalytic subunit [Halobacteriovorax sp. DA5]POB14329.1 aspartate carbamoyltransferase [Halobacteriovorax sp. DA5]
MIGFPSILEGIEDLNREQVEQLLHRAQELKLGSPARLPLKRKISVATSFLENSTRTKLSFEMAIKKLEGIHINFDAEKSSLKKGESLEQTLLTLFYQGIDICIVRTTETKLLEQFKDYPPIKIINGGDGTNQHPTQALLDLFTLKEYFKGELAGKKVCIVGDCTHSRVTHSLMDLLPLFGIEITLCGPKEFMPAQLPDNKLIKISDDLDETLKNCDAIYLLRIQNERHEKSFDMSTYNLQWGINVERLLSIGKTAPIFHPGPANIGIEVDSEIVNSDLWMAHKQVENSIYIRMAIIEAMITNGDTKIGARYNHISALKGLTENDESKV